MRGSGAEGLRMSAHTATNGRAPKSRKAERPVSTDTGRSRFGFLRPDYLQSCFVLASTKAWYCPAAPRICFAVSGLTEPPAGMFVLIIAR